MFLKSTYKNVTAFLAGALIMMLALTPAAAQNGSSSDAVVSDFLKVYSTAADKIAQLADAMPEDKYSWRPAEGVRSAEETILHVTSAHYFFGSRLGGEMPEGIDPQAMQQADMSKAELMEAYKESVDFMKETINGMESSSFDEEMDMFGSTYNKRQLMYMVGDHAAEHLGQLIAYARMNNVTPPWSQGQ